MARLFMILTMYHCVGGDRLTEFDPFRELVAWVEHGTAPERIVANQRDGQGRIVRSRPVFPYPAQTRYIGTGKRRRRDEFRRGPAVGSAARHRRLGRCSLAYDARAGRALNHIAG